MGENRGPPPKKGWRAQKTKKRDGLSSVSFFFNNKWIYKDGVFGGEEKRLQRIIFGVTETATMFVGWDSTACVFTTLTGDTAPSGIPRGGFPSGIGIDG